MQAEWGSDYPVSFAMNAKMCDCDGVEVPMPRCPKCGQFKMAVMGKQSFAWICANQECHEPKNI